MEKRIRGIEIDFDGSKNVDLIPQELIDWYPAIADTDEEKSSELNEDEVDHLW